VLCYYCYFKIRTFKLLSARSSCLGGRNVQFCFYGVGESGGARLIKGASTSGLAFFVG
jgi:hypothetical protein